MPTEVEAMDFTSIASTQAEKLVSMLRRTASFARDNQRDDYRHTSILEVICKSCQIKG